MMAEMQYSDFFEFFRLEKFPKVEWMFLFQDPDKYGTRIELADTRKVQQCQCCGEAIRGKAWALKTGAKGWYRYYNYLCERCFSNAPSIISIWLEAGQPGYNSFSEDLMNSFKQFRKRLVEKKLVKFATEDRLKDWRNNYGALQVR